MGLISMEEYEKHQDVETPENYVAIRSFSKYRIQPDVRTFPLFCNHCQKVQSTLYVHRGSRYGQVGDCACQYCGNKIYVTDTDNIVLYIRVNGSEIDFKQLYLLEWKWIELLGTRAEQLVLEKLAPLGEKAIRVNQLCELIEMALEVGTYSRNVYQTDEEFSILPEDINRWISLLEHLDVGLPDYVKKIKEGEE